VLEWESESELTSVYKAILDMDPHQTPDVRINEVATEIQVTEGVGPLSAEQVKKLVALVLAQVKHEQDRNSQRQKDTAIRDQAYVPRIGD
jgi:hypothetical protein